MDEPRPGANRGRPQGSPYRCKPRRSSCRANGVCPLQGEWCLSAANGVRANGVCPRRMGVSRRMGVWRMGVCPGEWVSVRANGCLSARRMGVCPGKWCLSGSGKWVSVRVERCRGRACPVPWRTNRDPVRNAGDTRFAPTGEPRRFSGAGRLVGLAAYASSMPVRVWRRTSSTVVLPFDALRRPSWSSVRWPCSSWAKRFRSIRFAPETIISWSSLVIGTNS